MKCWRGLSAPGDTHGQSHMRLRLLDEIRAARRLEICAVLADDNNVEAWVKSHRLYLEIPYLYFGGTYRYRPDSWSASPAAS